MASGIASLLRPGGVPLKPITDHRHQIRNAGQVPVGVRDPRMSDIGRDAIIAWSISAPSRCQSLTRLQINVCRRSWIRGAGGPRG